MSSEAAEGVADAEVQGIGSVEVVESGAFTVENRGAAAGTNDEEEAERNRGAESDQGQTVTSSSGHESTQESPIASSKEQQQEDKTSGVRAGENKPKRKGRDVKVTIKDGKVDDVTDSYACARLSSWQWSIPAFVLCPLIGVISICFSVKSRRYLKGGQLYEARWAGKVARFSAITALMIDIIVVAFLIAAIVGITQ